MIDSVVSFIGTSGKVTILNCRSSKESSEEVVGEVHNQSLGIIISDVLSYIFYDCCLLINARRLGDI